MDKYKKLATNTIIVAIGTFSSKALSFLLMPFVTRMMTSGQYGAADLVQQTANVLIPIIFLQVNSAALRFALDKAADKTGVFTVGVRTTLQGFLVFLLFAYPLSLIRINDFRLGDYIILICVFVLVSGTRQLCQQFVRGMGHIRTYAIDGIIATATTLLFTLIFLGPLHMGVTGYIVAIIASDACSITFFFITQKLHRYLTFGRVDKRLKIDMLKYSVPMMPTIILWWVINVSDRYMITYFISSADNGLYTAASKIPNFIIIFSTIFIDAWQLSAVDEYDNDGRADFFTKVFRIYSGGTFAVASLMILLCQLFTKLLVAPSYYNSWRYVPILVIATSTSCLVNFLASVYMAEKKSFMAMVTALAGAATNVILNLILIPRSGANGAAIATLISFVVVFASRAAHTRKYVKIRYKLPILLSEIGILAIQCMVILFGEGGRLTYALEILLVFAMLLLNMKPIKELSTRLLGKYLKKKAK